MGILRKSLFLAAALALVSLPGQAQQITCEQTPVVFDAGSDSTKLVTGDTRRAIYICALPIKWLGTGTVKLVTGTGSNCGTNQVALTPAWAGTVGLIMPDSTPIWRGLRAAPGLDLCLISSPGTAIQAELFYVQR